MIIPSTAKLRPVEASCDSALEKVLGEMPLRILPVVPQGNGSETNRASREPSFEARRMAQLIGKRVAGEVIDASTDHAWLIVLGHFAQALGLVEGLEAVPIRQRKGPNCEPQTKLIEFLVGILGGIEYLQDLNLSNNPITKDSTVIEAWAQETFVHYSGDSRTLEACDETTLLAVMEVLQTISRPVLV